MAADAKDQKSTKKLEKKRSRSDDAVKKKYLRVKESQSNIPFQLLMCNFRRKKILEVIKDA